MSCRLKYKVTQDSWEFILDDMFTKIWDGSALLDFKLYNTGGETEYDSAIKLEKVSFDDLVSQFSPELNGHYIGSLSCNMNIHYVLGQKDSMTGFGTLNINNAKFANRTIIGQMADFLKLPILQHIVFSSVEIPTFRIQEGYLLTDLIRFNGTLVDMKSKGQCSLSNGALDFSVSIRVSKDIPVVSRIPFTKDVINLFNQVAGKIAGCSVKGSVKAPKYEVLGLGLIERLFTW